MSNESIDLSSRPRNRKELPTWYQSVLEAQRLSGLSMRAYASQLGVTPATLYQWKRRLALGDQGGAALPAGTGLVELALAEPRGADEVSASRYVVHLGKDRSIEIANDFDPVTLGRLIQVVSRC